MKHENANNKIHLQVGKNSYLLNIEPNEALIYKQAAKEINDLLNEYRRKNNYVNRDFTDDNFFVMIALQLMIKTINWKGNLNMEKIIKFSCTSQALIMENIANRVQTIINDNGLTIDNFCNITGIEKSKLVFVLNHRISPSLEMIIKIKQTFQDVDLNWLINGEN
ncbi:cell division protein ZapA [uncultured Bacteroides sp.]|uniref:cell division protein ZapA n=1 Tax=uncultured Bacteroides sp. TaxID=162156 RepID=UPI002AA8112F|nr:cell division protein ZapA [uncultured Bacteroides sp.]